MRSSQTAEPVQRGRAGSDGAVLRVYQELCQDHRAIDDFRTKLMGFLPVVSTVGFLLLSEDASLIAKIDDPKDALTKAVAFGTFFAAVFTLILFMYEIRNILRCTALMNAGCDLEERMCVRGPFLTQHKEMGRKGTIASFFSVKLTSSAVYSFVFGAWLFIALKCGFGWEVQHCFLWAAAAGFALCGSSYVMIRWLVSRSCEDHGRPLPAAERVGSAVGDLYA